MYKTINNKGQVVHVFKSDEEAENYSKCVSMMNQQDSAVGRKRTFSNDKIVSVNPIMYYIGKIFN